MKPEDIFQRSFLDSYRAQQEQEASISLLELEVIERKQKALEPIIEFLDLFIQQGVYVHHSDAFNPSKGASHSSLSAHNAPDRFKPQLFNYTIDESSESCKPGLSIFFNHPAVIEIAIPNNQEQDGKYVVHVGSYNQFSYLLQHKFSSASSLCEALAKFLLRCTVEVRQSGRATGSHKVSQTKSISDYLES